jgi:ribosomal protein S18 acetylase RimI-like enzyme
MPAVNIKQVSAGDIDALLTISKETFFDAFAHVNNAADMELYAQKAFNRNSILAELHHPGSAFYFALDGKEIAGYLKLNTGNAQTELKEADGLEVERIYVHASYQGQQIGWQLLKFAINTAKENNKQYVWLGVWEHNSKALGFYKQNGFTQFGTHKFLLGNDEQTDLLMRKELE